MIEFRPKLWHGVGAAALLTLGACSKADHAAAPASISASDSSGVHSPSTGPSQ